MERATFWFFLLLFFRFSTKTKIFFCKGDYSLFLSVFVFCLGSGWRPSP